MAASGEAIVCARCGRENEPGTTNCVRCGIELASVKPAQSSVEELQYHCFRHPRVATNLKCGRCDRPICTKCAVIGPNGVRCPECARQNIPLRPGAVAYEVKRGLFSILRASPWSIWILIMLAGFVFSMLRSCGGPNRHREAPPVEQESTYEK